MMNVCRPITNHDGSINWFALIMVYMKAAAMLAVLFFIISQLPDTGR